MTIQDLEKKYHIECNHCGADDNHWLSIKFFDEDIKKIETGEKVIPRFHIKCTCVACGKYIKFVSYNPYIYLINDKQINYGKS